MLRAIHGGHKTAFPALVAGMALFILIGFSTISAAKNSGVSFNFDDAEIVEVANVVFGEILKVNYVIDPKINGKVTFRTMTPIPEKEVLKVMEIILRMNGMGVVVENGLYRIVSLDDVTRELIYSQVGKEPDEVSIELITMKNVSVEESFTDIEHAVGLSLEHGKVKIIPILRMNALLVVASTQKQLEFVRRWVTKFDVLLSVTRPKVFVHPVKNGKAKDISELLNRIFLDSGQAVQAAKGGNLKKQATTPSMHAQTTPGPSISLGPAAKEPLAFEEARIFPDENTNSIIIIATPDDYKTIRDTIEKIDSIPRQVLIEVTLAEINLGDDLKFGVEWSFKNTIKSDHGTLKGKTGFNSANLSPTDLTGFTFLGLDLSGEVRAFLQLLASDSRLTILASPHLLALDRHDARIQIGDQIPIVTSETNVTGTTDIQRTIQYRDTGIILNFKPQVNEGGLISMKISQEVSDFAVQQALGQDLPVITTRNAQTNVVVHDGQTIVIGGLIRDRITNTREYIPVLGNIPILGYLFGYNAETTLRTELLLLVTPRVIRNQFEADSATSEFFQKLSTMNKDKIVKEVVKVKKPKVDDPIDIEDSNDIYE